MSTSAVCRVCLVRDVRMHSLSHIKLLEIYEKLTSTKVRSEDRMPKTICYVCYSQLQKCSRLSNMALRSEQLLRNQYKSGIENVTHRALRPCPALNLGIVQNLSVMVEQSMFLDDSDDEIPPVAHRHGINYVCINDSNNVCTNDNNNVCINDSNNVCTNDSNNVCTNEITPLALKIEVSIKNETDEGDLVKTEKNTLIENSEIHDLETEQSPSNGVNKNNKEIDMHVYCDVCSKQFATKEKLQKHMRNHNIRKLFSCGKCDKSFYMILNLQKHLKICTVGNSTLTSTYHTETLKDITQKTHLEKSYICDRCSNKFKTKTHLKTHMRIHSGDKPYTCDVCSKSFNQISNLRTHINVHKGTKPFACEVCGKAFLTNGTLKTHMRCHTRERPFTCKTCGMTFGFKCSLNQHIRRLHTEVKAFPCNSCSLSFNHEVGLTGHMRTHTAERPHSCDTCNKTFTSARNLKGHMQVHSGARPHVCNTCGTAYKRPEHLRQHMKSTKCKAVIVSQSS